MPLAQAEWSVISCRHDTKTVRGSKTKDLGVCTPKSSFVPSVSHFLLQLLIKSDMRKCFTDQRVSLESKYITKRSSDSSEVEMNAWRHVLWNIQYFLSFFISAPITARQNADIGSVRNRGLHNKFENFKLRKKKVQIYLDRREKYFILCLTMWIDWVKTAELPEPPNHTTAD